MTQRTRMQVTQLSAGGLLDISITMNVGPSPSDPGLSRVGLGVTASSTPPATFGDFSHIEGATESAYGDSGSYWDGSVESFGQTHYLGTVDRVTDQIQLRKFRALDSDYAAGKYLWAAAWNSNSTPGGSDVPDQLSAPYVIR